ncbi:MAG: TauD/TfdA family dioxygenase [Thiotrichales bacterium]|nr:TauD/TfdA family dioxygenase [Thiotrichales bacterium]
MDSNEVSRWCDTRRETHATGEPGRRIEIRDPYRLRATERDAIAGQCARFNFALYRFARGRSDSGGSNPGHSNPGALSAFASAMGLHRRDLTLGVDHHGIAAVRVVPRPNGPEMIPFTSRALNWHTDGYYNALERSVRSIVMHCASPAASGGETTLLDPDLVYATMHAQDPALVEALAHPYAMTIPAHEAEGTVIRPARAGPVFRFLARKFHRFTAAGAAPTDHLGAPASRSGEIFGLDAPPKLYMRYTMRTRSIQWRSTPDTTRAVIALEEAIALLASEYVHVRFEAGEGVICNNVLHRRSAFVDGEGEGARRVMLRIRSLDPVSIG